MGGTHYVKDGISSTKQTKTHRSILERSDGFLIFDANGLCIAQNNWRASAHSGASFSTGTKVVWG